MNCNKVLQNFEDMRQALHIAKNGDMFLVAVDFHKTLLLQAAWRQGLDINVKVVRNHVNQHR